MDYGAATDQFVSRYNGIHIDEDGYFGAQCWDVVARYAREVVGCPSFPTGSGGAEGLFRIFADPIPQYFDKIANTPDPNQVPVKGDVLVFMASYSPPWGHTGLVISADSSGVTLLEQNGNNPGGVAYIKKRGWTGVSGWLRPKQKGPSDMARKLIPPNIVREHYINYAGVTLDPNDPALQNRYEDPDDDEFWRGMVPMLNNIRKVQLESIGRQQGTIASQANIVTDLQQQIAELGKRPTAEQLAALQKSAADALAAANDAKQKLEQAQAQADADKAAGDSFLRRLGQFIKKYLPGGN